MAERHILEGDVRCTPTRLRPCLGRPLHFQGLRDRQTDASALSRWISRIFSLLPLPLLYISIHRKNACKIIHRPGGRIYVDPTTGLCPHSDMFFHSLVVPIPSDRAPAATPLPAIAAAAAAATSGAVRAALASVWWRAHKGEVDVDGLVEELGVVGAVDGGTCLLKGGILDKCVALWGWSWLLSASGRVTARRVASLGGRSRCKETAGEAPGGNKRRGRQKIIPLHNRSDGPGSDAGS